jgi:hypothetical protein
MRPYEQTPDGSEHIITIKITRMYCDECKGESAITTKDEAEAFGTDHNHASGGIRCFAEVIEPEEFAGQHVEVRFRA